MFPWHNLREARRTCEPPFLPGRKTAGDDVPPVARTGRKRRGPHHNEPSNRRKKRRCGAYHLNTWAAGAPVAGFPSAGKGIGGAGKLRCIFPEDPEKGRSYGITRPSAAPFA
ncbi:hypothetical protein GCM10011577_17650 [Pseudarthrobacter polychromogenes]|uniref:Uncharacterized protein n=1 Tax=Pseudarthrobacter polychromogenes TaxID=1676 RepID=A0ABQ1XJ83_9MICC|nr:hypothetical protein GCM10011577_17650 [Pseudarthrobacter polychromogenes]